MRGDRFQQHDAGILLQGIPAVEEVGILRGQEGQAFARLAFQLDRRREIPEQRRHRSRGDVLENKFLFRLIKNQRLLMQIVAVCIEQPECDGDQEGLPSPAGLEWDWYAGAVLR